MISEVNGVMVDALESLNVPFVSVNPPAKVIRDCTSSIEAEVVPLFSVMLLKAVVELPLIVFVPVPVKLTMPPPAVKVELLVQLPAILIAVPAVNVPAVKIRLPLMVKVAGGVKLPVVSVRFCTVIAVVLPLTVNVCPAVLLIVTI